MALANVIAPPDISEGSDTSSSYGSIKWVRNGNVVTVNVNMGSLSSSAWRVIGTLPQGCRPTNDTYNVSWVDFSNNGYARVIIYANGEVKAMGTVAQAAAISFVL